jgi:uncharacterized protein (TIGR02453 family)
MSPRREREPYFTPRLFQFLTELKANNTRPWFDDNRERYERDVKEPMVRFIADFGPRLKTVSPQFRADPRPVGGSMFRIHRDIRFSKDKSPYKTNVGAHFPHLRSGRDAHAPGFYLHLASGQSFGAGGLWHPDAPALTRIRDQIASRAKGWEAVRRRGIPIQGDALKRVPSTYDQDHPFAEDLKRKDFYTTREFREREVCSPDFMDLFLESCRTAAPLVKFLTKTLGLSW